MTDCILSESVAFWTVTLLNIPAVLLGMFAFSLVQGIGERRSPRMTFEDADRRKHWSALSVPAGLVAYSLFMALSLNAARAMLCG